MIPKKTNRDQLFYRLADYRLKFFRGGSSRVTQVYLVVFSPELKPVLPYEIEDSLYGWSLIGIGADMHYLGGKPLMVSLESHFVDRRDYPNRSRSSAILLLKAAWSLLALYDSTSSSLNRNMRA